MGTEHLHKSRYDNINDELKNIYFPDVSDNNDKNNKTTPTEPNQENKPGKSKIGGGKWS